MQGIDSKNLMEWICEIQKIPQGKFICPAFLKPFHLVTMGLAIKTGGWSDFQLPKSLETYAIRMKLWDSIGINPPRRVKEYSQKGKFLPVQRFDEDIRNVQQVVDALANIVLGTTSKKYQDSLAICLEEIVNNFFDHANAEKGLPCLIAAQNYPKGKLVQVAISDAGIGIRRALSDNDKLHERLNSMNACELASELGVTGNPEGHSGYGLALAKGLMKACDGRYMLYSGDELFWVDNNNESSLKTPCQWNGTL